VNYTTLAIIYILSYNERSENNIFTGVYCMYNIEDLKKYKTLLDEGVISQEDFDKKKAELLSSPQTEKVPPHQAQNEPTKKGGALKIVIAIFVILMIIGMFIDDPIEKQDEASQATELSNKPPILKSTQLFKQAFNHFASEIGFKYDIANLEISGGMFKYMLNKHLALIGTVDKDDSLKELLMIGTSDGTWSSGADIFLCMGVIMSAVDPTLQSDGRGNILRKLKMLDGNVDFAKLSAKTEKNGFVYSIHSNAELGIMFSVTRK
jgi:hypothetical protein